MRFPKTILNGSYPTNPLWMNLAVVAIFEILVVIIEAALISWYLGKKDAIDKEAIYFIVIVSNVITFLMGFAIQVLLVGFS